MATGVLSNDDFYTNIDDKSLEIFSLIWLDANVDVKGTRETEVKLRSIINHIKKFQDVKQCQHYIEQTSQKDRLVIIVSGRLGQEIVPYIHQLRQVISIYVYCMDKKNNEQWALKFTKVKSVVVDLDELVCQITADHKIQKKVEEPLSINIFTTNVDAGKSTTGVNGQFVFSQILVDCLLRLKSTEIDKNELINLCQSEYEGNYTELSNLREFQQDYSPNKVLLWYTKETFFYKTLNAALRTQNIHMIFLFRSLICDLYHQLQEYQSKEFVRVYRCQLMSNDELHSLQQNIGQFISVNSFFSTSDERRTALFLLGDMSTQIDLKRVLFEIDADPNIVNTKPFANISKHSYFPDESEVLFMIGSIFRLNNIDRNDDQIWTIKMTLCNDDEHDLKQVLMHMKQQIENEETNLRTLGNVLWEMGKFDLAEKYFTRSLKQLPSNDSLHISLYEDLGKLASQRGDYDMSMKWRKKLLTFKEENPLAINVSVNKTNDFIGQSFIVNHNNINTKWKQYGITVAGGNGQGNQLNQLSYPEGIYVDDDHQTVYIADCGNDRIVGWTYGTKSGQVVAGGNGQGNHLNQLNCPSYIFVDEDYSVYVSERDNHRVMKWMKGAKEGIVVAGKKGEGNRLTQLSGPQGVIVDHLGNVYVADGDNDRIMRWCEGSCEGSFVVGGNGEGKQSNQFDGPTGLSVDAQGNLYVADYHNHRIQKFEIDLD
ncbi:unnamed protein product [Adineta steineri]|uniref:Uncharacterized protein n=1 Tax=Adineta steineri TaxID=433720 RepID=A0A814Q276_9BILA|nr:unnamed protein product [Adineta steineri]CAF1177633.1 unnamed protein product [Adineta steineri]